MTQTLESEMMTIPATRRAPLAAPVLIRVPALPRATIGTVPPRRRLRREVRVAGYWLLTLVPASVACAALGGAARPAVLLTVPSPVQDRAAVGSGPAPVRGITMSLEPAPPHATAEAEPCQVFLTGQILPLDAAEESTHGGH